MTTYEPLDRTLATLFADEAAAAAPSDLADRIVARTARLRPRPAWRARLNQAGSRGTDGYRSTPGIAGRQVSLAWVIAVLVLAVAASAIIAGALLVNRTPALRGVFVPAGSLPVPATMAILRPDGQVLIFGGKAAATGGLGSLGGAAEAIVLYDPATGTSLEIGTTAASVSYAVALADGRVLAIELATSPTDGGSRGGSNASLIDAATGRVVDLGPSAQGHLSGAGVLLDDGRVLLVGDAVGSTEAELFDPAKGTFAPTGATTTPMMQPSTTLLADGRVLVVGDREPIAELYDPRTGTFTETAPMSGPHEAFTATLLRDGRVLIAGGWATNGTVVDGNFFPTEPARLGSTVEIFDPATNRFTQAGPMVTPRVLHFAVALGDGRVLIGGGSASPRADVGSGGIVEPVALVAEVFDPATGSFTSSGSLSTPRFGPGAIRLLDGHVLVIGSVHPNVGGTDPIAAASMERYQ